MKQLYIADIESTDFKENLEAEYNMNGNSYPLEFKLGCFIQFDYELDSEIERYHSFNQKEFAERLIKGCSRKNKRIVYFHNLKFDSKFLITTLLKYFNVIKPVEAGGKMHTIKCYKKRNNGQYDCILEFKDSLAILLSSLRSIGEKLEFNGKKYPKLDFDFDYSNKESIEKGIEYCYRDAEIPYYAMKVLFNRVIKEFPIINKRTKKPLQFIEMPLTIASFSKKVFTHVYEGVFYKVDLHMEEKLRKHYFGGRTECFDFNLLRNGIYADENSEYPFVLANNDFVNGKTYMYKYTHVDVFERFNDVLAIECKIDENMNFPLYPIRHKGKIYYTNGIKTVLMTRKEYEYLEKNNYLEFSHRLLRLSRKNDIKGKSQTSKGKIRIIAINYSFRASDKSTIINFSELYNTFYNLRKKYDTSHIFNYVFKIFMNSGYGKLGESYIKEGYEYINDPTVLTKEYIKEKKCYEIGNSIVHKIKFEQKFLKVNLFNAVLTTSYARFDIWLITQRCEKNNVKCYYTDTDSAVISKDNSENIGIEFSESFGAWKIEMEYTTFQAIDSKEYYFTYINDNNKSEFRCKYKGVPNDYLSSKESLVKHIKEGTYINLIGSFKYCQIRHSKPESVHIIHKHKQSYFSKRIIQKDLTSRPLFTHEVMNDAIMSQIEANNKQLLLHQLKIH